MQILLDYFHTLGYKNISFVIVNSHYGSSPGMLHLLTSKVRNIPVYQEKSDEPVWSTLGGGKDDMFVYDKCGRLTHYIPMPLSIITSYRPIVQTAVERTYLDNICGESCDSILNEEISFEDGNLNITETSTKSSYDSGNWTEVASNSTSGNILEPNSTIVKSDK